MSLKDVVRVLDGLGERIRGIVPGFVAAVGRARHVNACLVGDDVEAINRQRVGDRRKWLSRHPFRDQTVRRVAVLVPSGRRDPSPENDDVERPSRAGAVHDNGGTGEMIADKVSRATSR